jgi:hypothetical protein
MQMANSVKPEHKDNANSDEGTGEIIPLKGAEIADTWAKKLAITALIVGLVYCLFFAGLMEWSHELPFQAEVNFALFAAFIVIAGAIERFLEPLLVVLPPYEKRSDSGATEVEKTVIKEGNERAKADRALLAYCIALVVGIVVSSVFGFYFLETMGVSIGMPQGTGATAKWVFANDGEKVLRGLDIFITALIITGGTKPLHDMITSIEKKKEAAGGAAANKAA